MKPARTNHVKIVTLRNAEIRIASDHDELIRIAVEEWVLRAEEAVRKKDCFTVALSGGSTPAPLYKRLATDASLGERLPWDKTHLFWGDERYVLPDHPSSNYRMVREALLSHLDLPAENVHRIKTEVPEPTLAADIYERELRTFFHVQSNQLPRFDLTLLGMGSDGHTASLFPGGVALHETKRIAVAEWVERLRSHRITLTAATINNSATVLFLVTGIEKSAGLRSVLQGESQPDRLPAQVVRPTNGRLIWLTDEAAASRLDL